MTCLAIIEPDTLVGSELRQQLRGERGLWDEVRLLRADRAAETTLGELDGATLVQPLSAEALRGVDLLFVCGGETSEPPPWADAPPGATTILVAPEHTPAGARPIVAGLNLDQVRAGTLLVSPHPALVLLGLLLAPLRPLGLRAATAWLAQPTTMRGRAGMDELMEQTRALLTFREERPTEIFGHQLTFNLLPARGDVAALAGELAELLGGGLDTAVEVVQGAVFHSFAASVLVELAEEPGLAEGAGAAAVVAALAGGEQLEAAEDEATLGPITVAGGERIVVGRVRPAGGRPGRYWLWAAMDNLTRGGALNALAIARAVLA